MKIEIGKDIVTLGKQAWIATEDLEEKIGVKFNEAWHIEVWKAFFEALFNIYLEKTRDIEDLELLADLLEGVENEV